MGFVGYICKSNKVPKETNAQMGNVSTQAYAISLTIFQRTLENPFEEMAAVIAVSIE